MAKSIKDAILEAEERLEKLLPDIEKRHQSGVEKSTEEPDGLKSGSRDDLEIKRAIKEQEDEQLRNSKED